MSIAEQEISITQHDQEIQENLHRWNSKPLLRQIYKDFHRKIAAETIPGENALTVELGSGIGNIKEVIPHCIRTDLFSNPWIDQTESAYSLSFEDNSVSNIILFDVFHHLRYPGTALNEFHRVLVPGGRVIIFDPCMSALGTVVYGVLHPEPIALTDKIEWTAPATWTPDNDSYYAAQGNAYRIFFNSKYSAQLKNWEIKKRERLSALSYVLCGGYTRPQMYPTTLYPLMRKVDSVFDMIPSLFATRLLVTLQKS